MKNLVVLSCGLAAAGAAAVITAGVAVSQPGDQGSYNVVGEPYQKALQELKSQGVHASFGGSFGGVLPQSECLVNEEKVTTNHRVLLMLDCSQKAADQLAAQGPSGGGGPTVGSNGVTTVTPTPVVPIAGAPGAGAPMPPG